jgi:hypothetical protein
MIAMRLGLPPELRRKGSFGWDSAARSHIAERPLPMLASCRQQPRPLLDFLVAAVEAALQGIAPQSLLEAPQGGFEHLSCRRWAW